MSTITNNPSSETSIKNVVESLDLKKGQVNLIAMNRTVICCSLNHSEWRKIFSAITLIISIALLSFLICYSSGVFHFEKFIGSIGANASLCGASIVVLLSCIVTYLSFKNNY